LTVDLELAVKGLQKTRDPGLKQRLESWFEDVVRHLKNELNDVDVRVASGDPLAKCWPDFRKIERKCVDFFGECLAFSVGDMLRAPEAGLDGGLCAIADVMLADLSRKARVRWGRLTVVSEREYYQDLAQIIRLRYPATTAWDLTVAAHEFGHFVGPNYWTNEKPPLCPFRDYLKSALKKDPFPEMSENHIHEYFADLFAIWALGPAYACTCILGRFDPSVYPFAGSNTHPGDGHRAHAILWALEQMEAEDEADLKPSFAETTERLKAHWQACLAASNVSESVIPADERKLRDDRVTKLWEIITSHFKQVRYQGWGRAVILAGRGLEVEAEGLRSPELTSGDVLRDVLNAASHLRLTSEGNDASGAISGRALTLCRKLAGGG